MLQENEVIITRSGTVGVCKVFDLNGREDCIYIPSGYLIVFKVDEDQLMPEFVSHFLNSSVMRKYFDVFGTGKTQRNISQGDVKRIPIPSFSKDEQAILVNKFNSLKKDIRSKVNQKEKEIIDLIQHQGEL